MCRPKPTGLRLDAFGTGDDVAQARQIARFARAMIASKKSVGSIKDGRPSSADELGDLPVVQWARIEHDFHAPKEGGEGSRRKTEGVEHG